MLPAFTSVAENLALGERLVGIRGEEPHHAVGVGLPIVLEVVLGEASKVSMSMGICISL